MFFPMAMGAGHQIYIEITTPKDGAILTTNTTTLEFTVNGDVPSDVLVTVNGKDVFNATAPSGSQSYAVQLELRLGSNTVYVSAFNSSAGTGDLVKIEIWYKGEEGLPIRWTLDPQYVRVEPGNPITFNGALYGYAVWNPPVLRPLADRSVQVYLKPSSQIHGYGDQIGEVVTDELGEFSFTHAFADEGVYVVTFRYAGDDVYAPGIVQAEVNVTSHLGGGGSGGGSSGHAPARGVWITAPKDGDVLSGTVMVEAISTEGAPRLYLDSEDLGEMAPTVFAEHYYAIIDTTQFPDGEHEIRAVRGVYNDSIVVMFSNAPSSEGEIKVEIIAPGNNSVVPLSFRLVFAVAWENVTEPGATVYVDGSPLPGLDLQSATPPRFSNDSGYGEKRYIVPIILNSEGQHTIEVVASADNCTTSDSITVFSTNQTHERKESHAYVAANGWIVHTPPDAVAVYKETESGIVFGSQRGVGRWFIPAPSALCFSVSPTNITVVYADGSTEDVVPSLSVSGMVDWLQEEHSVPIWTIVLIVVFIALVAWRWRR